MLYAPEFLNWVCTRLMGPAIHESDDGGFLWHCPRCDPDNKLEPRFSVRPRKANHPIKFKCHCCAEQGCEFWGDEFDIVRFFYSESYESRCERVARLRREYEADFMLGPGGFMDAFLTPEQIRERGLPTPPNDLNEWGVPLLQQLLDDGRIHHEDLLHVTAELNSDRELELERKLLWRD